MVLCILLLQPALPVFAADQSYAARGRASWYGTTSEGKQTANGEIYTRAALTAAHKGLPFGTVLRVYNLRNGKHVLVRVNDRGPYIKGRILDLSVRAAESLRMTMAGVVPVAMEVVTNSKGEPLNSDNKFFIHVTNEPSALKSRALAGELEKKLTRPVQALYSVKGGKESFALCLGPYDTFGQAQKDFLKLEQKQVRAQGIIEAPASGGDLPRYTPPRHGQAVAAARDATTASTHPRSALRDLAFPQAPPLYAASSFTVGKSFLFFTVMKSVLTGLRGDSELFRLPDTALSSYIYTPS